MQIRKIAIYVESAPADAGLAGPAPVRRGYAGAVLSNGAGCHGDLAAAADMGELLGGLLTKQLLDALRWERGMPLAYGKAAVVGGAGHVEDAAAILHPRMGAPMRSLIGQGAAIIPSTVKHGPPGACIDIPLHGADDEWDFAMLDSLGAHLSDAPLSNEIVIFAALAIGRRAGAVIGA